MTEPLIYLCDVLILLGVVTIPVTLALLIADSPTREDPRS